MVGDGKSNPVTNNVGF